jgi:uncharacterized membrane protein YgcG
MYGHIANRILTLAVMIAAAWPCAAVADERILSFHSEVAVQTTGDYHVTETITVRAERNKIQRGIYRDLPRYLRTGYVFKTEQRYSNISVLRDGKPEPFHTELERGYVRVYIGSEFQFLPYGTYTYELRYTAENQVRYFDDHDEVYWNATGNFWSFPIDEATATVRLPQPVNVADTPVEAYTGRAGASGQDYTATVDTPGVGSFTATRGFQPREGMTVVMSFPKGIVTPPEGSSVIALIMRDDKPSLIAYSGIVALLIYYVIAWCLVGRDPAKGRIALREEPPEGYSPAALHYIRSMGYNQTAFTAAILNMAYKGYLYIEEGEDLTAKYTLVRTDKTDAHLAPEERVLAEKLFADRDSFTFSRKNRGEIAETIVLFKKTLSDQYKKGLFAVNGWYLLPGFFGSVALVIATIVAHGRDNFGDLIGMSVFLGVWSLACVGLAAIALGAWFSWLRGTGSSIGAAIFMTLFAIPFWAAEVFVAYMLMEQGSISLVAVLISTAVLFILFAYLLRAPTVEGRLLLDELEGFRRMLRGEGQRRLARADAAASKLFQAYLPYAVILNEGGAWAEHFEKALRAAGQDPSHHPMPWYRNPHGAQGFTGDFSRFTTGLSTSISSSVTSSSGSSGSGGGGSSGGGGGGGGGGGW